MGYYNDVYSSPEKYGLEPVGELNEDDLSYEFHMLNVWQHKETGVIYWQSDSGYSCPSPYENYLSLDALNEIKNKHDLEEFVKNARNFPADEAGLVTLVRLLVRGKLI